MVFPEIHISFRDAAPYANQAGYFSIRLSSGITVALPSTSARDQGKKEPGGGGNYILSDFCLGNFYFL